MCPHVSDSMLPRMSPWNVTELASHAVQGQVHACRELLFSLRIHFSLITWRFCLIHHVHFTYLYLTRRALLHAYSHLVSQARQYRQISVEPGRDRYVNQTKFYSRMRRAWKDSCRQPNTSLHIEQLTSRNKCALLWVLIIRSKMLSPPSQFIFLW